MAPLYSIMSDYENAVLCQRKALELETDETAKIQLLTKIAGNLKKANDKEGTIEAAEQAYQVSLQCFGERDITTWRCLANLAAVLLHFGLKDEAKQRYHSYIENWQEEWNEDSQHQKLKKQVQQALANF